MSLKLYHAKRNLKLSGEPDSKKMPKSHGLQFVIQKHAARRLHYDLRLELDGVLKSWAVPKGPTLEPGVKRLAIQVEDHPLSYGSFEGTIPEGHYGAGKVIVWDHGTYSVHGDSQKEQAKSIREQLEKGELKFFLQGKKLKGEFALIRLNRKEEGKEWILIKKKDQYQSSKNIQEDTHSVISKADLPEDPVSKAPKAKMPHHIKPMLAHLIDEPFDDSEWLFEIKWDGYRAIAEITPSNVHLYSRNFLSFNETFSPIVEALREFKKDLILDGEIAMINSKGRSQFQLLQNYLNAKDVQGALRYCIFDILYYRGHNLRDLPLIERKKILKELLAQVSSPYLLYSDHIQAQGKKFFNQAVKSGLEGIIAKNSTSVYASTRSRNWLKIKTHQRQEVVIGGFTQPRGGRKKFGALVVGVYKDGKLIYTGHTGGGFNTKSLTQVYELLEPLITTKCPFDRKPKTNEAVTWVKPKLVCEVQFQEWTKDLIMRQPVFQGMRLDKPAQKVVKEEPEKIQPAVKETKKSAKPSKNSVIGKIITHPEKVLWPDDGYTKLDLLEYYQAVGSVIVPHLKNRPISLHRYPNGIKGEDFFQKEASKFIPDWIETVSVQQADKKVNYILIQNVKSLLYAANLGSIEIHPFLSRYQKVDYPDFLVLDIDPVGLNFNKVVEVTLEAHHILEGLGISHYCKTSGKRGIHLYLPLNGLYEYPIVEQFAKLLAQYIHQALPSITSLVRNPAKRQKKVYIDYLQNSRTKSVVAPYSVRPVEGATVSTPLEWTELTQDLDPKAFTIKTIPKRILEKGDLFKGVLGKGVNLKKIVKALESSK